LGTKLEDENQKQYGLNSITVAKLSHHGSKNSSSLSLLKSLAPDVAIFSVGKNSYGHPNIRVIEDLNILKIPFLRTDLDGDIQIKIKEQKLQIDTEKSKKSYIILN
jgi:beta-lactamase superfamily II metal-dependent hydrolase